MPTPGAEPGSDADLAILATLRPARPHDALLGEETGRTGPTTT
jgi:fructose-1,6-bisphosphatase/inositol monophosphatase family enzyme